MTIDEIFELHFITLIENVPSIVNLGILSYREARRLKPSSVANPDIQARRRNKSVPNAGQLHSYANLYFHARNPMMCAIQGRREELVVLKVNRQVLYEEGVIISDGNAAGDYTRFYESPAGLSFLSSGLVFARDWRSPDQITYWRQKSARCAEVLVPRLVQAHFIEGAYVCSVGAQTSLNTLASNLTSTVEPDLFTI